MILARLERRLRRLLGMVPEFSSAEYWENRYRSAGNSGAGSYGRLAEFKAEVLNRFVHEHDIGRVVELGSGDGHQLSLARYPRYLGIDVSPAAIRLCRERFDKSPFEFRESSPAAFDYIRREFKPDLALSLDVLFHLVEDAVFETYMRDLFSLGADYVIIYASDGTFTDNAQHVVNRAFTPWVRDNAPDWHLSEVIANRYPFDPADGDNTSFSDFFIYRRSPPAP